MKYEIKAEQLEMIIKKQDEYIAYLMKLIRMNNIVWDITIGPRSNYESEIDKLKKSIVTIDKNK